MHTLPKVPGTKVRGTTYHLNIPVPVALRAEYGGREVLEGTLRTSDPKDAERQVRARKAEFDSRLASKRFRADQARLLAALDPTDRALVEELGGPAGLMAEVRRLRDSVAFVTAAMPGSPDPIGADPLDVEEDSRTLRLARARDVAGLTAEIGEDTGEVRRVKAVAEALGEKVPPAPDFMSEGGTGLRDLSLRFADARSYTSKNRDSLAYTVRRWIEFHGDVPLEKLTRKHLADFDLAATKLPVARIPARLPMREAVALAQREGLQPISEKVRERLILHLMQMMTFALNKGDVATNPWVDYKMDRAKVKVAVRRKLKRKPFTPAQVSTVLAHVAANMDRRTMDWWLPAFAAFTGATREELRQLTLKNVMEVEGVLCIQITDEDEHQTVKNEHRFRVLPVPQAVLRMGFADYVAERRTAGGTMLWMEFFHDKRKNVTLREVRPDPDGRYTEGYGDRFSRKVLVPLGIKTKELVFHSFRHSWTDAAREAHIPDAIRRLLAGRVDEGSDSVEAGYGGRDLIHAKVKGLEEVARYVVAAEALRPATV